MLGRHGSVVRSPDEHVRSSATWASLGRNPPVHILSNRHGLLNSQLRRVGRRGRALSLRVRMETMHAVEFRLYVWLWRLGNKRSHMHCEGLCWNVRRMMLRLNQLRLAQPC